MTVSFPHALVRRTNFATLVGTILEQYDMVIYVHLLPIIAPLCFAPLEGGKNVLLQGFLSFAMGYMLRPMGGIVFGHLGDRLGRKRALLVAIACMSIPTFIIGILPSYAQIGALSGIILYSARSVQSLSVVGELASSAIIIVENAPLKHRNFFSCLWSASFFMGGVLGGISGWIFTQPFMPSWSWRIAFFLGAFIALVGLYMRLKAVETADFQLLVEQKKLLRFPVLESLKKDLHSHFCYIGMIANVVSVYTYIVVIGPMIMRGNFNFNVHETLEVTIFSTLIIVVSVMVFGFIADFIGKKKVFGFGLTLVSIFIPLAFNAADAGSLKSFLVFHALSAFGVGVLNSTYALLSKSMYPTERRCSGSSLAEGLGAALFGSIAPFAFTLLKGKIGSSYLGPSLYLWLCALFGMISVYFAPNFLSNKVHGSKECL
jgi:MHS family proline/betaine transporter-like MFS transporter